MVSVESGNAQAINWANHKQDKLPMAVRGELWVASSDISPINNAEFGIEVAGGLPRRT